MVKISKKGTKAWVTFTAPAVEAESFEIKGSWSDWQPETMKRKKNGDFYLTKVLKVGEDYEFGYLPDGEGWLLDEECERTPTPFGSENSLLRL